MSVPLAQLLTPRHLVLDSWTPERTFDRPGAGVSCLYSVRALDRAGRSLTLYAGATTATLGQAEHPILQTSLSGTPLSLWLHPHDPMLPALPWALSPPHVAQDVFGDAPGSATEPGLTLSAYRPLRRAVVRATSGDRVAFLKILLPGQAEGLRRRHQLLAGTGVPAAAVIPQLPADPRARGAVALSELAGDPLLRGLRDGGHGLGPGDLTGLLDQLPDDALALNHRPAWAERSRAYGMAAAAVLPAETDRVKTMAGSIEALVRALDPGPVVPVHGDFYEGNLLAAGGRITGVLDLDGMGPGHRVDDLACFIGHLAVLAELSPDSALPRELEVFHTAFERAAAVAGSSAAALNARAAGVALSLVAGARGGAASRGGAKSRAGADASASRTENALTRLRAAGALLARAEAEAPGQC